jgi:hypothetical protein
MLSDMLSNEPIYIEIVCAIILIQVEILKIMIVQRST